MSVITARTSRSPTCTPKDCVAVRPSTSLAVTVTVTVPVTTADNVSVAPATVAVTAVSSDDAAA